MAQFTSAFSSGWATLIADYSYTQNITGNYTDVTARLLVRRDKANSTTYKVGSPATLTIAGETRSYSVTFRISDIAVGGTKEYASFTKRITHNTDGTYPAFTVSAMLNLSQTSLGTTTASGSVTLPRIPRYTTITSFYLTSRTFNSVSINWSAADSVDAIQYSLNGGGWVGTGGNPFIIGGLNSGTVYSVRIRVKRADSQLWTESTAINVDTYPYPSISSAYSFNLGDSFTLRFNNPSNSTFGLFLYAKGENDAEFTPNIAHVSNISGTSYTWTLLESEINRLYTLCPNGTKVIINIAVQTNGSHNEWTQGTAYTVRERCMPKVNLSKITVTDTKSIASGNIIKNKSSIRVNIASGIGSTNKSAGSISSCTVSLDGTSYTKPTSTSTQYVDFGIPTTAGNKTLSVTVKDSRGYISQAGQVSVRVHDYREPWFDSLQVARVNGFEEQCRLNMTAQAYNSTGFTNYIKSITYSRQEIGSSATTSGTIMTSTSDKTYTYNSSADFDKCSQDKKYNYTFTITDALNTVATRTCFVNEGLPVLGVFENATVGVGSYVDTGYKFQVGGKTKINNDIDIGGSVNAANFVALGGEIRGGYFNYSNGWLFSDINIAANNVSLCYGAFDNLYNTALYAKSLIICTRSEDGLHGTQVSVIRESASQAGRTILRPEVNGGAYLGSSTYRWNTGFFTNTITQSDRKTKDNISDLGEQAVQFIMAQKPSSYTLKNSDSKHPRTHMGLIAQDVAEIAQNLDMGNLSVYQAVNTNDDGEEMPYEDGIPDEKLSWGLNYNEFIAPLIATVQYQEKRIDELETKLAKMEQLLNEVVENAK